MGALLDTQPHESSGPDTAALNAAIAELTALLPRASSGIVDPHSKQSAGAAVRDLAADEAASFEMRQMLANLHSREKRRRADIWHVDFEWLLHVRAATYVPCVCCAPVRPQ